MWLTGEGEKTYNPLTPIYIYKYNGLSINLDSWGNLLSFFA